MKIIRHGISPFNDRYIPSYLLIIKGEAHLMNTEMQEVCTIRALNNFT
jgi:hypothetical protein